jgi:hypothetical protein
MMKILQENYYWNKGIILQEATKIEPCKALVEQNDRRIDIWLQGKHPQSYLDILREDFRGIHRTMKSLEVKEYLEIEEGITVEYNHLVGLKRRGKTEYSTETKDYLINDILKIIETSKNMKRIEQNKDDRGINIHVNPVFHNNPHFENKPIFNNYAQNPKLEEFRELLTELKIATQENREWQSNFTTALQEVYNLEDATKPNEVKAAKITIDTIFKKLKDVKDWTAITLLPVDLHDKVPKLIELYHQIFHL